MKFSTGYFRTEGSKVFPRHKVEERLDGICSRIPLLECAVGHANGPARGGKDTYFNEVDNYLRSVLKCTSHVVSISQALMEGRNGEPGPYNAYRLSEGLDHVPFTRRERVRPHLTAWTRARLAEDPFMTYFAALEALPDNVSPGDCVLITGVRLDYDYMIGARLCASNLLVNASAEAIRQRVTAEEFAALQVNQTELQAAALRDQIDIKFWDRIFDNSGAKEALTDDAPLFATALASKAQYRNSANRVTRKQLQGAIFLPARYPSDAEAGSPISVIA